MRSLLDIPSFLQVCIPAPALSADCQVPEQPPWLQGKGLPLASWSVKAVRKILETEARSPCVQQYVTLTWKLSFQSVAVLDARLQSSVLSYRFQEPVA